MLEESQLVEVRDEFISILKEITREGSDIDGLIGWLDANGFFAAPATSKYHCSFEGGLALHSINTYKCLCRFAKAFASKKEIVEPAKVDGDGNVIPAVEETKYRYGKDTLIIVGLLHDICKANLYEKCSVNSKVYSKYGKSKDALGHYDWQSSLGYKVVDEENREIYGDNGFSSYFIISGFIPLTTEESVVIANCKDVMSDESNKASMFQIMTKYPLSALLVSASLASSYCIENPHLFQSC